VHVGGSAAELGDEGALFAEAGFLVGAGLDRVAVGRALVNAGAEVLILDDGLQHRRLFRDLDIVVVDARFPSGRATIPAGEAREAAVPPRADLVVLHHGGTGFTLSQNVAPIVRVQRVPGPWSRGGLQGPVAAFAGIGRPADFLEDLEVEVARFRALTDHRALDQALCEQLVDWADGLPLVCTAKDAVRLPAAFRDRVWYRDVQLVGPPPLALLARIGLT